MKAARSSDKIKTLSKPMQRASEDQQMMPHCTCVLLCVAHVWGVCGVSQCHRCVEGFRTPRQVTAKDPTLARSETEENLLESTFEFERIRRKFRNQTSDNMDRRKAEMGRLREEKRREEERRSKKRKSQKKEDPGARKGRKVAKHSVFFQWFVAPGGSKSRLAKAAAAEPAGQMRDEKLHAVVAQSTFRTQMRKTPQVRTHFGS